VATGIRKPRMHGTPPKRSGSTVIRGTACCNVLQD
jgi:hypothetical protein